ncbi:MAG TPA: HD-GYP domain-containing protein [Candidatus Atribacteria bacterium]|nr:HD-GYP domain-containing protein [Candidatus Atribacteria bacterium]
MLDNTVNALVKIIGLRDPYTSGHQKRVSKLAVAIARELEISEKKVKLIKIATLIHDIGKATVPMEILNKPAKLARIEYNLIKAHPQIGYDILKDINFPWAVEEVVLQHHERIDGSGYPRGLKEDEILIGAKIIAMADVVETMFSHRPYRPALGIKKALEEISQNRGILYDPKVADTCLKLFREKKFEF